jgi:hypothetical protein
VGIINGNFFFGLENIVSRNQSIDTIISRKIPMGIGYATAMKLLNDNTEIFLDL